MCVKNLQFKTTFFKNVFENTFLFGNKTNSLYFQRLFVFFCNIFKGVSLFACLQTFLYLHHQSVYSIFQYVCNTWNVDLVTSAPGTHLISGKTFVYMTEKRITESAVKLKNTGNSPEFVWGRGPPTPLLGGEWN